MQLNRFLILTDRTKADIVEYKYAWYWIDGYEYVDARYLYLGYNKKVSVDYIKLFAYKLFYINPKSEPDDVFDIVDSIVANKIKNGVPVFLRTIDYVRAIDQVYENLHEVKDWKSLVTSKYPKQMFDTDSPAPVKRVEFKHDLRKLLEMNDAEKDTFNSIKTQRDRKDYLFNLSNQKKAQYAISIHQKHKVNKSKAKINSAIEALSDTQEVITMSDVSKLTGIGLKTVAKYINDNANSLDKFSEYTVVVNKKTYSKMKTLELLQNTYAGLVQEKGKVNKIELHRNSKVSRVTIDKYWKDLKETT